MIVLGESVAAATAAFRDGLGDARPGLPRLAVAAVVIVFALWWLYFDRPVRHRFTSLLALWLLKPGRRPLLWPGTAALALATPVTTVTSSSARQARLNWADLQSERKYSAVRAYGQSKLADLFFALELDRRSRANDWDIVSNAAHPGTTLTGLYSAGPNLGRTRPAPHEAIMTWLARRGVLVHGVEDGLLPILYAAASPRAGGGRLYGPDGFGQFTGKPAELPIYRSARDEAQASRLWDYALTLA
ncbi:hypothetical protein ACTI_67010 [Actinoplanes sp. OR16]|uniref:low temperature requirement protein A n=1 Tax=Actinoplanes sp. OR16 TaxID=946334 RepID=UPI000F6F5E02|nr:low temperature requirement protein A [Actinoplanes sp. OR16]BBH70016.1 hypothetical protein ACTI_67010 [Actinoplanes sp. OR16]